MTDFPSEIAPAYGRDYRSKAAVLADLAAGKDFVILSLFHPDSGRYIGLAELRGTGATHVLVRYDQQRRVARVALPREKEESRERA